MSETPKTEDAPPIRAAATVVLIRRGAAGGAPSVLMGMRGARAAFMPSKYVFPGGAVEPADGAVPLAGAPGDADMRRLAAEAKDATPGAILAAAIRELWEETGLILGRPGAWPADRPPAADWRAFAQTGHAPDASALGFAFRAVTPPGRPRRFDARFLIADADALACDPDDFSRASDELSDLAWVPADRVRALDLPFVTEVALAEILSRRPNAPAAFFDNRGARPEFRYID